MDDNLLAKRITKYEAADGELFNTAEQAVAHIKGLAKRRVLRKWCREFAIDHDLDADNLYKVLHEHGDDLRGVL